MIIKIILKGTIRKFSCVFFDAKEHRYCMFMYIRDTRIFGYRGMRLYRDILLYNKHEK